MFDDKKPLAPSTPVIPTGPVEDMFGEEERGKRKEESSPVGAERLPPAERPTPEPPNNYQQSTTNSPIEDTPPHVSRFGFLKVVFVVIIILGLVASAAYAAYRIMVQQPIPEQNVPLEDSSHKSSTTNTTPSTSSGSSTLVEPEKKDPGTFLDTDGDGLTNAEELEAQTSSTKPDTDGDGLGDREEVEVYDTNPLKPDTDGDTFLDGQEVAGGYNPNGAGRLFSVPE